MKVPVTIRHEKFTLRNGYFMHKNTVKDDFVLELNDDSFETIREGCKEFIKKNKLVYPVAYHQDWEVYNWSEDHGSII